MSTEQPQVTVAQVRAAIFDVLDGRRWLFDQQMFVTVLWTEDDANGHRHLFADRVVQRLTELRERGLG